MENNKTPRNESDSNSNKDEEIKGSDADTYKPVDDERFKDIGTKQAGEDNTEEEVKGSDADTYKPVDDERFKDIGKKQAGEDNM